MSVDLATQLIGQDDPHSFWQFNAGESKTITVTVDRNIKSLKLKMVNNIDSDVTTAPGRSAESPYDALTIFNIQAGNTKILYEDWVLKAIHQMVERQNPMLEDKPTVTVNQTNDEWGFEIIVPCPVVASPENPVDIEVSLRTNVVSVLDKSGAGKYTNFDGYAYLTFIPAGAEPVVEQTSHIDSDTGTGNLTLKIPRGKRVSLLVISNENASPSTPSAGGDESKYENTVTDCKWLIADGLPQIDRIKLFRQLISFSEAQNNIAGQTGLFTYRPVSKIVMGANNYFQAVADGTSTRMRLWALIDA